MPHEWYNVDELARQLGRDKREIEKLASRGRLPAHKRGKEWQFHAAEITQWLEQEMRDYSDSQLAAVEAAQASPEVPADIPVSALLSRELVQVPLEARTKRSVLESLIEVAGRTYLVWEPATILKAVQEREALHSTAFDLGVAFPHPRNPLPDAIGESLIAFGRTASPIPFGATNNSKTDCFFLILCEDAQTHLQVLARLSRMIQREEFLPSLRAAQDSQSAFDVIIETEQQFQ